jgi:glycine/D-amino acid oxidase-like deaminating enzyme
VDVVCRNPLTETNVVFKASTLSICNNGFAAKLLPNYDLIPGRGQVMITKPIEGLPFNGIFHFNDGYYYFREYKGCVLFGGGRNLDIENETATTFELNKKIQDDLQNKLRELILPKFTFETDLQWTGIMGFGKSKRPILKKHSERITVGIRMGGMGVAIGSEIGFALAALI